MNEIIPSTKLRVVSVHKLQGFKCWRKYFWQRVLNLEPKKLNFNFWYGGVLHAGFEALLLGKDWRGAMKKESRRRIRRHIVNSEDQEELNLQTRLLELCVAEATKQPWVKKCKLKWAEKQFRIPLKCGVLFCASLDGLGTDEGALSLFEIKTAKSISDDFYTSLSFDMQIHAYGYALRSKKGPTPKQCTYCIFRKPQKRVKKKQTVDDFLEDMKEDFHDRAKWYYIHHKHQLGSLTISETAKDIEAGARLLKSIYDNHTERQLLNVDNWPKNSSLCLEWGACPFLILCKYPKRWQVYTRAYQQREMLYEEEKDELNRNTTL